MSKYAPAVGQANQAALEAQTNQNTYSPPDLLHHHPGVAKAWCHVQSDGTLDLNYNISSVSRTADGTYTVNFDTDFSTAVFSLLVTVESGSGGQPTVQHSNPLAGSSIVRIFDEGQVAEDNAFAVAAFGDHA